LGRIYSTSNSKGYLNTSFVQFLYQTGAAKNQFMYWPLDESINFRIGTYRGLYNEGEKGFTMCTLFRFDKVIATDFERIVQFSIPSIDDSVGITFTRYPTSNINYSDVEFSINSTGVGDKIRYSGFVVGTWYLVTIEMGYQIEDDLNFYLNGYG